MRRVLLLTLSLACTAAPEPEPEPEPEPAAVEQLSPEPSPSPTAEPEPTPAPPKPEVPNAAASFETRFGGIWVDVGKDVALAPDGGYVIVGRSERVDDRYKDDYQLAVVSIDPRGEPRWSKYLGPEGNYQAGEGISVDPQGITLVGATNGEGAGSDDAWVVRLDWQGETQWTKTFGSEANDFARSIARASDGGWLVVGGTKSNGQRDAMAWRVSASGELLWSAKLGGTGDDVMSSVVQSGTGWVLAGATSSTENGTAGHDDGWVIALDPTGQTTWSRAHGSPGEDRFFAIAPRAPEGPGQAVGWVVAGEAVGMGWVAWLDPDGAAVEERLFHKGVLLDVAAQGEGWIVGGIRNEGLAEAWMGWIGPDYATVTERKFELDRKAIEALVPTPDGGAMLTGNWASINSNYGNIWACKLDANGVGC